MATPVRFTKRIDTRSLKESVELGREGFTYSLEIESRRFSLDPDDEQDDNANFRFAVFNPQDERWHDLEFLVPFEWVDVLPMLFQRLISAARVTGALPAAAMPRFEVTGAGRIALGGPADA